MEMRLHWRTVAREACERMMSGNFSGPTTETKKILGGRPFKGLVDTAGRLAMQQVYGATLKK